MFHDSGKNTEQNRASSKIQEEACVLVQQGIRNQGVARTIDWNWLMPDRAESYS